MAGLELDRARAEVSFSPDNLLGQGGFADVYRGKYRFPGSEPTEVAFKLFKNSQIIDAKLLALIQAEAQVGSRLQHEHVVGVYGVLKMDEGLTLVMELAESKSLWARLRNAEPPGPPWQAIAEARGSSETKEFREMVFSQARPRQQPCRRSSRAWPPPQLRVYVNIYADALAMKPGPFALRCCRSDHVDRLIRRIRLPGYGRTGYQSISSRWLLRIAERCWPQPWACCWCEVTVAKTARDARRRGPVAGTSPCRTAARRTARARRTGLPVAAPLPGQQLRHRRRLPCQPPAHDEVCERRYSLRAVGRAQRRIRRGRRYH